MSRLVRDKDAKKVSVGCPRSSFQIHFHDFASLTATKNHVIASPMFTCRGHQWQLDVYPGGDSLASEGQVPVYLHHLSQGTITASFGVKVIDKLGCTRRTLSAKSKFTANKSWGWSDFISRSDILDKSKNILDSNGTLTVVVSIEEEPTDVFVPKNPFLKMMQEMFNDQNTADVCFEVGSADQKKGKKKKSKSSTLFYAHRLILEKSAPMLAALCGSKNDIFGRKIASVNDIKPDIFSHLLSYVYGRTVPQEVLMAHAIDFIAAADKYSIVNLKLEAEAAYVESTDITFDNVMDNLLYADSMNCALIKEAAIDFLVENSVKATEQASFANFPAHLLKDIFVAINKVHGKSGGDDDAFAAMSVSELRKKLDEKGLDVDGSREAMIESIKSHS